MNQSKNIISKQIENTFLIKELLHHYKGKLPRRLRKVLKRCGSKFPQRVLENQERAIKSLANNLAVRELLPQVPNLPVVDPENALRIGYVFGTLQPLLVPYELLTMPTLIVSPTGGGKTTLVFGWISQFLNRGIKILFMDYKIHNKEGRRLLNRFKNDVLVERLDQERNPPLKPGMDSKYFFSAHCSEIAKNGGLMPQSSRKPRDILLRVEKGMKPGDLYINPAEAVSLFYKLSKKTGDKTLKTIANAYASFNTLLGDAAYVSEGPPLDRWPIEVKELGGIDPRDLQCIQALRFLGLKPLPRNPNRPNEVTRIYYSDEASIEFAPELASQPGSGRLSPQRRMITQIRNTGTGIIASVQTLKGVDPILIANAAINISLRVTKKDEQKAIAHQLHLPEERAHELGELEPGVGFFKSIIHPEPVKFQFDNFDCGPYLSDEEVEARMKEPFEWLDRHTIYSKVPDEIGEPISYSDFMRDDKPEVPQKPKDDGETHKDFQNPDFLEDYQSFLKELVEHPDVGTNDHIKNLKWKSSSKFHRIKKELLDQSCIKIEIHRQKIGPPVKLLIPTEKGRRIFL